MMGGLDTEMAALVTLGDLLDGSGWTAILVNANMTSAGWADAMPHASRVRHNKHAQQVTAAGLNILQQRAQCKNVDGCNEDATVNFGERCAVQAKLHQMFH
jgi:hypothetical protein